MRRHGYFFVGTLRKHAEMRSRAGVTLSNRYTSYGIILAKEVFIEISKNILTN
jgi:hypothetical protein